MFHHLLFTDGRSRICNVCGCRSACCVVFHVCCVVGGCVCLFVLDFGAQITIVGPHLVVDYFSLRNVQRFAMVCWFENVAVCCVGVKFVRVVLCGCNIGFWTPEW